MVSPGFRCHECEPVVIKWRTCLYVRRENEGVTFMGIPEAAVLETRRVCTLCPTLLIFN